MPEYASVNGHTNYELAAKRLMETSSTPNTHKKIMWADFIVEQLFCGRLIAVSML